MKGFPPQSAVTLINHVLYFGGNDITTPLVVLLLYAFAGAVVIGYYGRIRPARKAAAGAQGPEGERPEPLDPVAKAAGRRRAVIAMTAALGVCAVMQCLFATTLNVGHLVGKWPSLRA